MSNNEFFKEPLNIVICGVGGQGNILAARLLGKILNAHGYIVTIGETYGASQRGGSVMSHIRISKQKTYSPLIPLGKAHVILGLEPLETLRILVDYGNPDVLTITNTYPILPVTVNIGVAEYPPYNDIKQAITKLSRSVWFVDATHWALDLGMPQIANMIILGAFIGLNLLPLNITLCEEILKENFPLDKEMRNLLAFRKGLDYTKIVCPPSMF